MRTKKDLRILGKAKTRTDGWAKIFGPNPYDSVDNLEMWEKENSRRMSRLKRLKEHGWIEDYERDSGEGYFAKLTDRGRTIVESYDMVNPPESARKFLEEIE